MKDSTITKRVFYFGLLLLISFSLSLRSTGEPQETIKGKAGFYSSSHALIIGIGNYQTWPDIKNATKDAAVVWKEFESRGFEVANKTNLTLNELENTLEEFFTNAKVDRRSRLFIWYSGHSHTIGGEGFLVPTDAPGLGDSGFRRKAFPVERFRELSRHTAAKHVYMVFDSCFSSTIFKQSSGKSPEISIALRDRGRQFLCSGKDCQERQERQERQDNGCFRDLFLKAIENEVKVDVNEDGYLTASEIGQFIKKQMVSTNNKGQIPYYGNLKGFDNGDFVFFIPDEGPDFFRDPLGGFGYGPDMIEVRSGALIMGDFRGVWYENERPVHGVKIEHIAVGRFEVTFEEYDLFCDATGQRKPLDNGWGRGNRPVINVSWEDARAYTRWLSEQTGYTYRLPTEAEWEYMARAGTETDYWWGNEPGQNNASCHGCGAEWGWDAERKTAPVRSFKSNPFGIYDTVGNVWEWTCSQYTDSYIGKETKCLGKFTTGSETVVLRGGAWDEKPENCRVSRRRFGYPGERSEFIGFRVVKELKKED
jgi:formylglycine-generating enzyme required for sulfatase activity